MPPIVQGTRLTITSNEQPAAYPCGVPRRTDAEHEALLARGDNAYYAAEREHWRKELDFRARGLSLTRDVDSIEVTRAMLSGSFRFTDGRLPISGMPIVVGGTPCSGAREKQKCEQELEQKRQGIFAHLQCVDSECPAFDFVYAVTTRGDEVRTYSTDAELADLLGPIDTPVEAWITLMAHKLSYTFVCDDPSLATHRLLPSGYEIATRMVTSRCRPLTEKVLTYRVTADGKVKLLRERVLRNDPQACVVSGRRPAGLHAERAADHSEAGGLFARMAHLEHASVFAFEILHRELGALGAHPMLLSRAARAREDEVRHVRAMRALARRFGACPQAARVEAQPPRSAFEIALENAGEGCVRELYGALLAAFQAARATDPEVRQALTQVAQDEARHAALAWDLERWLAGRLSQTERTRVAAAREQALRDLETEVVEPTSTQQTLCGLPSLNEAHELLAELKRFVLSGAQS